MVAQDCFSRDALQEFALGILEEEESQEIVAHLETYLACEETVASFDNESDTLIRGLKTPAPDPPFLGNRTFQDAVAKIKQGHGDSLQVASIDPAGQPILGDYRLLEPLGRGGMGAVYKAVHTRLNRLVAIKLLPSRRMQDGQAVARFRREMLAIGQMNHPSIVQATDAGELDGTSFLVMELVDGFDVSQVVRQCQPLTVADACDVVRRTAEGLVYAHQQAVIHRDIKPSNLMLTHEGQIKILDLGLALLGGMHGSVDELTTVGQLMGTLDYMAPEQCDNSHQVDERADVYSLGATLYKLLCGSVPYTSARWKTPLQKLKALALEPVPKIHELRDDLPGHLAEVVHRALAREADERFGSMQELAQALEPFCEASDLVMLWKQTRERIDVDLAANKAESLEEALAQSGLGHLTSHDEGQPKSEQQAAPSPKRGSSRVGRFLFTAAAVLLLTFGGLLIHIETNKGTLTIECARPDVEVHLIKADRVFKQLRITQQSHATRIAAGQYQVKIVGETDSLEVLDGVFTLRRGDQWIARIVEKVDDSASGTVASRTADPETITRNDDTNTEADPDKAGPRYEGATLEEWIGTQSGADLTLKRAAIRSLRAGADPKVLQRGLAEWRKKLADERSPRLQAETISTIALLAGQDFAAEAMQIFLGQVRQSSLETLASLSLGSVELAYFMSLLDSISVDLGKSAVVDALAGELAGDDPQTQYFACCFLNQQVKLAPHLPIEPAGSVRITNLVLDVTRSPHEELRFAAVDLLTRLGKPSPKVASRLLELIGDPNETISSRATTYAAQAAPDTEGLVELLGQRAQKSDVVVAAAAISALAELGKNNQQGIASLIGLLEDESWGFALYRQQLFNGSRAAPLRMLAWTKLTDFADHLRTERPLMEREYKLLEPAYSVFLDYYWVKVWQSPAPKRYSGKTFDQWIHVLQETASPEVRVRALEGLQHTESGSTQKQKAAANAILAAMRGLDFSHLGANPEDDSKRRAVKTFQRMALRRPYDGFFVSLVRKQWDASETPNFKPSKSFVLCCLQGNTNTLLRFDYELLDVFTLGSQDASASIRLQSLALSRKFSTNRVRSSHLELNRKALADNDRRVQQIAMSNLLHFYQLNQQRNISSPFADDLSDRLSELCRSDDLQLKAWALEQIHYRGSPTVLAMLLDLLRNHDESDRQHVAADYPVAFRDEPNGSTPAAMRPNLDRLLVALKELNRSLELNSQMASAEDVQAILSQLAANDPDVRIRGPARELHFLLTSVTKRPAAEAGRNRNPSMTYDGRTFRQWRTDLKTELKSERRADALEALATLAGYGNEQAAYQVALETIEKTDLERTNLSRGVRDRSTHRMVRAAIRIIQECSSHQTFPPLLKQLKSNNPSSRKFALFVLSREFVDPRDINSGKKSLPAAVADHAQEYVDTLLPLTAHESPHLRAQALSALAVFAGADKGKLTPYFRQALADDELLVVATTIDLRASTSLDPKPMVEVLIGLLEAESDQSHLYAIRRIAEFKQDASAATAAVLRFANATIAARELSAQSTFNPKTVESIENVPDPFDHTGTKRNSDLLFEAFRALAEISPNDAQVVELLERFSNHPAYLQMAAEALNEIRERSSQ